MAAEVDSSWSMTAVVDSSSSWSMAAEVDSSWADLVLHVTNPTDRGRIRHRLMQLAWVKDELLA